MVAVSCTVRHEDTEHGGSDGADGVNRQLTLPVSAVVPVSMGIPATSIHMLPSTYLSFSSTSSAAAPTMCLGQPLPPSMSSH